MDGGAVAWRFEMGKSSTIGGDDGSSLRELFVQDERMLSIGEEIQIDNCGRGGKKEERPKSLDA